MKTLLKKLTSLFLSLLFTIWGIGVLGVSLVLMTLESMIVAVFHQVQQDGKDSENYL